MIISEPPSQASAKLVGKPFDDGRGKSGYEASLPRQAQARKAQGGLGVLGSRESSEWIHAERNRHGPLSGPAPHIAVANATPDRLGPRRLTRGLCVYTLKELPQPHVVFTLGFSNLNPEPSRVSM